MYGLRLPNLTIRVAAFSCIAASLAFVVSFPFLVVPSALAAPLPVAVNPTRIEITASPGDQVESSFKFWNGTDADLPVHLEGFDIGPQDEEGHATVEREPDKFSEGVVEARILRPECRSETGNYVALFSGYSGERGPRQPLGCIAGHHGTRHAIERSGGECADGSDPPGACLGPGSGEART